MTKKKGKKVKRKVRSRGERKPWDVDPIPSPRRPEMTVGEAHRRLWKRLRSTPRPKPSPKCPVCRRAATIRREYLKPGPVEFLVRLCRAELETPGPKTSREILPYSRAASGALKRGTDATYLERWKLIRSPERGVFELTRRGLDFVMGRIKLPRWADLYNMRCLKWSDEDVSIRQVLGKRTALLKQLYAHPEVREIRRELRESRRRKKRARARRRGL